MSYDSVDVLKSFSESANIQFPLLSDPESKVIRMLGIANQSAKAGSKKYNIAHPMTVLINSDRSVAGVLPGKVVKRHSSVQLVNAWTKISSSSETKASAREPVSALDFEMVNIDGDKVSLDKYKGKVVVMVNVASKCGLTPQYEKLQALYEKNREAGLMILGFPCNQFMGQEPGSDSDIKAFCQENYGVDFDMFSKIEVNGEDANPLYKFLTSQMIEPAGTGKIKWNFEKFVIGRDGKLAGRFGPRVDPAAEEFTSLINKLLESKSE